MDKEKKFKRKQSDIIWSLMQEDKWEEARSLLEKLLEADPDSHWLLSRIALTYYEQKNYEKALEYEVQALELAPDCPMVLWGYAGELDMLEYDKDAICVYQKLLRRGSKRIAYGDCGEGIVKARSLVNDCRYRLACLYADTGDFSLAKKYINDYISHRNRNYTSIYDLREAKRKRLSILAGKNPRHGRTGTIRQPLIEKVNALKAKSPPIESVFSAVNRLFKENRDIEARNFLTEWLKKNPQDHRALYRLADTFVVEENFEKCAEYLEQALKIEPGCPTALSNYSYVLYMLKRDEEAILICKGLIKRGVRRIAFYRDCEPGLRKAREFINDCRFILGLIYGGRGQPGLAKKYFTTHLAHRGHGYFSSFKLYYIKSALTEVQKGLNPDWR
jgi:tetratricopeptide (TPR) repeat protein